MALKQPRIKSKKIRNAARDQECTLQIAGVCNYDTSTTVLAHLPDESHGISRKSDALALALPVVVVTICWTEEQKTLSLKTIESGTCAAQWLEPGAS